MDSDKINREYIEIIKEDPDFYYKDYEKTVENVANSKAKYRGKPVPFLYQPMLYTKKNIQALSHAGEMVLSIGDKITKMYLESPGFRKKFGYSKLLEELILVDNGYDINAPMARFDILYNDIDDFKFCEFNTDGTSAMNEDNTLARILLETEPMKKMKEKYNISYFELVDSWVDESIKIFNKWSKKDLKPNVAIVDFKESSTMADFEEFKRAYIKKGYEAVIVDPRELEYINGKLYYNDFKIDLIYRRIVTKELMDKIDEVQDFINAYKEKAVCVVGSIKSQILHNKIIFKILHDKETLEFLSKEEREFIKKHIPYTGELKGNREIYNEVLNNKDKYIIKPEDLNESRGVYAGRDFTKEEWKEKIDESWNNEYLYQEFVELSKREFIQFENEKPVIKKLNHVLGIYMYNNKMAGLYARIDESNIISGLHGSYRAPNILVGNGL